MTRSRYSRSHSSAVAAQLAVRPPLKISPAARIRGAEVLDRREVANVGGVHVEALKAKRSRLFQHPVVTRNVCCRSGNRLQKRWGPAEVAVFRPVPTPVRVEHPAIAGCRNAEFHVTTPAWWDRGVPRNLPCGLICQAYPWINIRVQDIHEEIDDGVDDGGKQDEGLNDGVVPGLNGPLRVAFPGPVGKRPLRLRRRRPAASRTQGQRR